MQRADEEVCTAHRNESLPSAPVSSSLMAIGESIPPNRFRKYLPTTTTMTYRAYSNKNPENITGLDKVCNNSNYNRDQEEHSKSLRITQNVYIDAPPPL